MKKPALLFTFVCMFFLMQPQSFAQEKYTIREDRLLWTDLVTSKPVGYEVNETGDVEISTAEGLAWLISEVNGLNGCEPDNFEGRTVHLTNDVFMKQSSDSVDMLFTPIGNREHAFMGTFNGDGHTIEGYYVNRHDTNYKDLGLFGYLRHATVKNLVLMDCYYYSNSTGSPDESMYAGLVAGVSDSLSLVDNCQTFSSYGIGTGNIGGVLGMNRNSTVRNCSCSFSSGYMIHPGDDEEVGGVVAENLCEGGYADAVVSNSYFYGVVMLPSGDDFGGIVSHNITGPDAGNKRAIVQNCFALTETKVSYKDNLSEIFRFDIFGALAAVNSENSILTNCFAAVTGEYNLSLFGQNMGSTNNCYRFFPNGTDCSLYAPVNIGGIETSDLAEALNLWAEQEAPSIYKTWGYDEGGIPQFDGFWTGIAESASQESVEIHPNPVGDILSIKFSPDVTPAIVELYDLQGRRILTQTKALDRIPVEGLPSGTYLVRVTMDDGSTFSEKVVKK